MGHTSGPEMLVEAQKMVSGKDFAWLETRADRAAWSPLIPASFCLECGHEARSSSSYFASMR